MMSNMPSLNRITALFVIIFLATEVLLIKSLLNSNKLRSSYHGHLCAPLFSSSGSYLEKMVSRKKIDVESLLRRHQEPDDPLVMRMSYMASECKYNVTRSLKKEGFGDEKMHRMSIMVDMKRRSPTVQHRRNVVEFTSAGKFSELLTRAGADAFLINTDEQEYGGDESELLECVKAVRETTSSLNTAATLHAAAGDGRAQLITQPACIAKDLIIHPVQIAQALERGASGVLLIAAVVGADLGPLLDACTIMGTEPIVEVHTPNELNFALEKGATIFLVNMWDRITGQLFEDQAKGMASMLPMNSVAIAAGNIHSMQQVVELGFHGYDSVVLGRNIAELPDIKQFIDDVHSFHGVPRTVGFGFKGFYGFGGGGLRQDM